MHTSLEALLPWLSSGFWRWKCRDSLYSNKDQCLDLSIITFTQLSRISDSKGKISKSCKACGKLIS